MSTFKPRSEKTKLSTSIKTVDSTHKKFTGQFNKKYDQLPNLKRKLKRYEKELNSIENKDKTEYTNKDIDRRSYLKKNIQKLKDDISQTSNHQQELDYYCKIENLLVDYYDKVDLYEEDTNTGETENITEQDFTETNTEIINQEEDDELDKLNKLKQLKKQKKNKTPKKKKVVSQSQDIMSFLGVDDSDSQDKELELNRASILGDFLTLVDSDYSVEKVKKNGLKKCSHCGLEKNLVPAEGVFVCEQCGEVEEIIMELDRSSIKDQSFDKPAYPYKRISHYNEWLSQFQAKESTEIPDSVYRDVINELKKNRVNDHSKLTLPYMKKVLRKLKLNDYFDNIPHIISKITKRPPPSITREMEEELRKLFKEMQIPFEKHKPDDRVNFLSYSYVLHKLCEIKEWDDFLKCFPLLKSRSKLRAQDNIWKKICQECRWEYYPSV
uniref:Viral late gene transcription factor 3 zinc ribbon domain-containing protein n=1 Tax=viral metagenome TaxID=1070528 RepID=A0A6C0ADF9_9ZZZZ